MAGREFEWRFIRATELESLTSIKSGDVALALCTSVYIRETERCVTGPAPEKWPPFVSSFANLPACQGVTLVSVLGTQTNPAIYIVGDRERVCSCATAMAKAADKKSPGVFPFPDCCRTDLY